MDNGTQVSQLAPDDFIVWTKLIYRRGRILFPLASGLLSLLAACLARVTELLQEPWFYAGLLTFHCLVCVVLLFSIPKSRADITIEPRAATAVEQFFEVWERLWVFWIFLYLLIATNAWMTFFDLPNGDGWLWASLENLFNNLQTMGLVLMYIVLTKTTVDLKKAQSKLPWAKGLSVVAVVTTAEGFLRFFHQNAPSVLSDTLSSPDIFRWLSGICAGVALALVVGRLDSKYVNPPTLVMPLLYLYAIIQPAWSVFDNPEERLVRNVLMLVALALKCLLFIFVAWLLESGVLFFYLERMAHLIDHAQDERRKYLGRLVNGATNGCVGQPQGNSLRSASTP
jgi:hypothetical protein